MLLSRVNTLICRASLKVKNDHRSKFSNLRKEAWKIIRASTGFKPVTSAIPLRCSIAQLVEHRTSIAEVPGLNLVWSLDFFQASSFQLLKLENLLWWSFFTFIYSRSSQVNKLFKIVRFVAVRSKHHQSLLRNRRLSSEIFGKHSENVWKRSSSLPNEKWSEIFGKSLKGASLVCS